MATAANEINGSSRRISAAVAAARKAPTAIIVSVSKSVLISATRIEGTQRRMKATRRITDIALPGTYLPMWPMKYANMAGRIGVGQPSAARVRCQNQPIGARPTA
jgi:hypothetical protein